jgi:hypothetical protein
VRLGLCRADCAAWLCDWGCAELVVRGLVVQSWSCRTDCAGASCAELIVQSWLCRAGCATGVVPRLQTACTPLGVFFQLGDLSICGAQSVVFSVI